MDNNRKYFISILSSFINKQKPEAELGVNWEEIYKLAKTHSVSGMVYLMAKELQSEYRPDAELFKRMKKDFVSTAMLSAAQESEMDNIIKALKEAEIPHVLMKGYVMRNYYPAKEMRTMDDIDILIKPEDRERSHKLFQELGYTPGLIYGEVWDYTKGTVHLEIHTKIMSRNMHNGIDYVGYFSDAWNHAVPTPEAYTFEFDKVYHFLFLMVHMAKHFKGSGCGMPMIMDIAVYLQYFKESLNWKQVEKELEKLNLTVFSTNIYILCSLWFGTSFNFKLPVMVEGFYRDLSDYILSAGTFGLHERDLHARSLRNEYLESRAEDKGLTHCVALVNVCRKKLFPEYEVMVNSKYNSIIRNRPFMLPVGWLYRLIEYVLKKPEKYYRVLYSIIKGRKESQKQYEMISKLGL
jgi:hypothetical protein